MISCMTIRYSLYYLPMKIIALSHPLSELDRFKSHVPGGRMKEIDKTSMASLDNAHPQRASSK